MQIYLLDINEKMCQEWQKLFGEDDCIKIVCDDFCNFMKTQNVECIVSPANSFGVMLGGYDLSITKFFGSELMQKVQEYIKENYGGIQPVGSAFLIDIPNSKKKLIHCPVMEKPSTIKNENVIYDCMMNTLIIARENGISSIVIPAFGCGTGGVKCESGAKLMKKAYDDFLKE